LNLALIIADMPQSENPFSKVEPWSKVADGYAQTTLHFLSPFSQTAIDTIGVEPNDSVLDLACGPGTLTRLLASQVRSVYAVDFSPSMITILLAYLTEKKLQHVYPSLQDGQNLNFKDNSFDKAFSMFGLMFFPDRLKGFKELYRCLKPGGKVAVSSWLPVKESSAMILMFGALQAAKPDLPSPQESIFNLENRDVFKSEMELAGFSDISVKKVTHGMPLYTPEEFWRQMTLGSAPIVMLKASVDDITWAEMEKRALEYLRYEFKNLTQALSSSAWLATAVK